MKKFIFIILIHIGYNIILSAQFFEGKIDYTEINAKENLLEENKNAKEKSTFFIKDTKIKNVKIGGVFFDSTRYNLLFGVKWYIINDENRLIIQDISYDTIVPNLKSLSNKLTQFRKKEYVLGYVCTKYELIKNESSNEYKVYLWIADSLKTKNTYGDFMIKDLGIALKILYKFKTADKLMIATNIQESKLEDYIFELPDYPIKKVNMKNLARRYTKDKLK
ncbi:MAG: hypothetical protein JXR51_16115 [Bacteroidales bacterium]|nr:hypothetical protein [Bacteroidales bacterium]MBN2758693.1 hypothetical protein [Bacteroidales bacterium]